MFVRRKKKMLEQCKYHHLHLELSNGSFEFDHRLFHFYWYRVVYMIDRLIFSHMLLLTLKLITWNVKRLFFLALPSRYLWRRARTIINLLCNFPSMPILIVDFLSLFALICKLCCCIFYLFFAYISYTLYILVATHSFLLCYYTPSKNLSKWFLLGYVHRVCKQNSLLKTVYCTEMIDSL